MERINAMLYGSRIIIVLSILFVLVSVDASLTPKYHVMAAVEHQKQQNSTVVSISEGQGTSFPLNSILRKNIHSRD